MCSVITTPMATVIGSLLGGIPSVAKATGVGECDCGAAEAAPFQSWLTKGRAVSKRDYGPGAKARLFIVGLLRGLKPPPPSVCSMLAFPRWLKPRVWGSAIAARLKP